MNIITVTPRVSEKAYHLVNARNTYVFDAPLSATKTNSMLSRANMTSKSPACARLSRAAKPFATLVANDATQARRIAEMSKKPTSPWSKVTR